MSRLSNGRSLIPHERSRPVRKKAPRNHALTALAIAEKTNPEQNKIRRNRLGEVQEDGERQHYRGVPKKEDGERASKRRKIRNTDQNVDTSDTGSDGEGNEWHIGIDNSDEDSDLDSDNAMGESDEERFEAFAFRGSDTNKPRKSQRRTGSEKSRRSSEIDLSENNSEELISQYTGSDDEDGDLGEHAVDLATALDLNLEEKEPKQPHMQMSAAEGTRMRNVSHISGSGNVNEESDGVSDLDESVESHLAFSDEDDKPTDTSQLLKFVGDLQGSTANVLPERREPSNLPNIPSDFGVRSSRKLTLADLQSTVRDPNLIRSLKMLHNSDKLGPEAYKSGIPGKLGPPLSKRQQDRLDRAAAYEKSKETLNRWVDTVKQNRRVEHISFPLPNPDVPLLPGTKELMTTTQSQPLTSLEATIRNIMQESGLVSTNGQSTDDQVQAFEELEERKMPMEEVQVRRAELRKARELMFREEVRARRIKRIKSKSYRRVHRKERERMAHDEHAALNAAGLLNSDEERDRNDRRRAEERMGARHKENKWARGLKASGRAVWDADARTGITDLARRDEELRRRMEGKRIKNTDASESELSSSDSDDNSSSVDSESGARRRMQEKLENLDTTGVVDLPRSKLDSMAFMRRSEAIRKAVNDADIELLRQELGDDTGEYQEAAMPKSAGRLTFGTQQKSHQSLKEQPNSSTQDTVENEFEERLSDEEKVIEGQPQAEFGGAVSTVKGRPRISRPTIEPKSDLRMPDPELSSNPWIQSKQKSKEGYVNDRNSVRIALKINQLPQIASVEGLGKSQNASVAMEDESSSSSCSSSGEDQGSGPSSMLRQTQSRNEEIVKMMFAGDDVFEEFDREKRETIDEEGDQVIDNTLPGWGNWTGTGISKREQKRANGRSVTTVQGVQADKRKDAKLEKVIINEKRVKRNTKYLASELPHPFESRQQYERSLRLPLGPEWTTKQTYQDATKPRVLMKQGIIRPMERPVI